MDNEKTPEDLTPQEREKLQKQQICEIYRSGLSVESLALDLKSANFIKPLRNAEDVAAHNYQMERLTAIIGGDFDEVIDNLINNFARLVLKT